MPGLSILIQLKKDFDKLALTNQVLSKPWIPYRLDLAPKQWYPDGDERNEDAPMIPPLTENAAPAAEPAHGKVVPQRRPASVEENDGSIKSFSW